MTKTLQWSVCAHDDEIIQLLKDKFHEAYPRVKVDLEITSTAWAEYKQELTQIAIYRREKLDISQAGAPLVHDLVAMNALRPFSDVDIADLGGERTFTPITWQSCFFENDKTMWSIPVFSDPRAIIYWDDLLEKAGVDEALAFSSVACFDETFQKLRSSGIQYPWMLNIFDRYLCLQTASSWLWDAGVDFVSRGTGKSEFAGAEGLSSLNVYFDLKRYLEPGFLQLCWQEMLDLFTTRRAAVTVGNFGAARYWYRNAPDELRPHLKIAVPLKQTYVGGSHLVIWGHTNVDELVMGLAKFLTSQEIQRFYPLILGQISVRQDTLYDHEVLKTQCPIYTGFVDALDHGRMYPNVKFGGWLEDQLIHAFDRIWRTLLENPTANTEETVRRVLVPIARRYDNMAS